MPGSRSPYTQVSPVPGIGEKMGKKSPAIKAGKVVK